MTIQFCAIRNSNTGEFLIYSEVVWGMGSTMTGPITETQFEFDKLTHIYGEYNHQKLAMFENAEKAQKWINESAKYKLGLKYEQKFTLEIVTFADLDTIVEKYLLDKE